MSAVSAFQKINLSPSKKKLTGVRGASTMHAMNEEVFSVLMDIWEEKGLEFSKENVEEFLLFLTERFTSTPIEKIKEQHPNLDKKIKNTLGAWGYKKQYKLLSNNVFNSYIFIEAIRGPSYPRIYKKKLYMVLNLKCYPKIFIWNRYNKNCFSSPKKFIKYAKLDLLGGIGENFFPKKENE